MRDAIMKNGCEKNFENINWTFSSKQPWKYEFLKKDLSNDAQTQSDKKEEKKLSKKKKKQEEKLKKQQKQQQSGNDTTDTSINNIEKQIKKLLN